MQCQLADACGAPPFSLLAALSLLDSPAAWFWRLSCAVICWPACWPAVWCVLAVPVCGVAGGWNVRGITAASPGARGRVQEPWVSSPVDADLSPPCHCLPRCCSPNCRCLVQPSCHFPALWLQHVTRLVACALQGTCALVCLVLLLGAAAGQPCSRSSPALVYVVLCADLVYPAAGTSPLARLVEPLAVLHAPSTPRVHDRCLLSVAAQGRCMSDW